MFAPPGVPGRKSAPRKDAARARVIGLRREGLSVYEISSGLTREGTPLGRTAVSDILREEGFGRLLRGPASEASTSPATSGRDTRLPAAAITDFAALPARAHTTMAGLLLAIPDLVALDLPALAAAAGYPGTKAIPATSYLLALLALKLTATRRVSHVDDLLTDPAPALFAGLSILPKKTALTDYSYRLSHDHQRSFLAALDQKMIASGLATRDEGIFDLDFHAVMALGPRPRPGKALRAHPVPARPVGAHLLRPGLGNPQPGLRQRRHLQGHPGPGSDRVLRPLESRIRQGPEDADHGPEGHQPGRARRARRPRHQVPHPANALPGAGPPHQRPHSGSDYKTITLDRPGPHNKPRVHEDKAVKLTSYPGTVRQLIITGLGRDAATVIITNEHQTTIRNLISQYARRMTIEQRLAEIIHSFCADALSSAVNLNVDLDIVLCVLAQALLAAFRTRLAPATTPQPPTPSSGASSTVPAPSPSPAPGHRPIDRRAYSPVLRQAGLPADTTSPGGTAATALRVQRVCQVNGVTSFSVVTCVPRSGGRRR